jgi:hypothetical protein
MKEWKRIHPKADVKHRYGITEDDYQRMAEKQSQSCAICGRRTERLDVDHDHKTGKVRGLLCIRCNTTVGILEEMLANNGIKMLSILTYLGLERIDLAEKKSARLMERGLIRWPSKAALNRPGYLDRAQLRIDHGASILQVERSGHIIRSPPQFLDA